MKIRTLGEVREVLEDYAEAWEHDAGQGMAGDAMDRYAAFGVAECAHEIRRLLNDIEEEA